VGTRAVILGAGSGGLELSALRHVPPGIGPVGGISGGVFNPAVALGGAAGLLLAWPTIWI